MGPVHAAIKQRRRYASLHSPDVCKGCTAGRPDLMQAQRVQHRPLKAPHKGTNTRGLQAAFFYLQLFHTHQQRGGRVSSALLSATSRPPPLAHPALL